MYSLLQRGMTARWFGKSCGALERRGVAPTHRGTNGCPCQSRPLAAVLGHSAVCGKSRPPPAQLQDQLSTRCAGARDGVCKGSFRNTGGIRAAAHHLSALRPARTPVPVVYLLYCAPGPHEDGTKYQSASTTVSATHECRCRGVLLKQHLSGTPPLPFCPATATAAPARSRTAHQPSAARPGRATGTPARFAAACPARAPPQAAPTAAAAAPARRPCCGPR